MPTIFNFTSGVVADTDATDGSTSRQATQTIGADTLTVALDSASGATAVVMDDEAFFGFDILNLNGRAFEMASGAIAVSVTLSLDNGKIFDLTSINIADQDFDPGVTYIFTTTKGSVMRTVDTSSDAVIIPLSDPKLQGVTSVVITQQGGGVALALDDIRLDNITLPNAAPTFVGAGSTLTVAQNSSASSAGALLHVSDADSSQTMTWTQFAAPSHGTLSISSATAASGSADITPGGTITYTPTAGFAGVDTFTVQVSDGAATATRIISVNVGPATPGAPDLAGSSDNGASSTDNITNAATLSFSGAGAAGDSSSSVRVFLDTNGNGVYDGADATATATVANGAWTVNGLSTTGVGDGDYNVYAQVTSASGGLTSTLSSALVVHIDKTQPGQTLSGLALSADTGGSASDFITNTAAQTVHATLSGALAGGDTLYGSLDGGSVWTDITAKVSGGAAVDWTGVTLTGSGSLRLKVVDAAGNDGAIARQDYTLDTARPAAPSAPDVTSGTDTGASNTDNATNNTTPVLTGTAEADATVTIYDTDGSTVLGTTTAIGGTWSITSSTLSEGAHTLTVTATDAAGNVSAASSDLMVTIDTTSPTLAITSNASTLKIGDTATITFAFSEDPGATFAWDGASGDVVVSGGTLSAISGSGLTRTATFTPTASINSGTASITVASGSYADGAGNSGGAGPTPNLTFDTLAPPAPSRPALTSGSDSGVVGDSITNIDTPTFTGTSEAGATVRLYDTDETTLLGSALADGSGNWTIVSSQLSVGAHTITAKATDLAGNISSAGSGAAITIDTIAPPEPSVVTVVTPSGNQVTGDVQDNLIAPSGGADTVSAGGGNDTVQGGASDDVLQGNVGNDSIAAGGGSDLVYGGQSDDFVNGNTGDDRLYGDKGEDTLHGGQGADVVQGGQGNDYVSGDLGDDVLLGGQGDDQVLGGAGNDYLSGDLGSDTLTGGAGADIFHSFGGGGIDLVTDFNRAEGDRVMLAPGTSYATTQVAGDVHIDMVGGGQVILAGVQLSSLSGDWIIA